jgi:curved DNA-binding protein CbpA
MSVITPFAEARRVLGLNADEEDAAVFKRAYRRAVAEHPPDRDPDGFRRARDAYELLRDPCGRASEILLRPSPLIAPPALPPPSPSSRRGATAVALLRLIALRADPAEWRKEAP